MLIEVNITKIMISFDLESYLSWQRKYLNKSILLASLLCYYLSYLKGFRVRVNFTIVYLHYLISKKSMF